MYLRVYVRSSGVTGPSVLSHVPHKCISSATDLLSKKVYEDLLTAPPSDNESDEPAAKYGSTHLASNISDCDDQDVVQSEDDNDDDATDSCTRLCENVSIRVDGCVSEQTNKGTQKMAGLHDPLLFRTEVVTAVTPIIHHQSSDEQRGCRYQ